MAPDTAAITPVEAVQTLHDLRHTRDTLNHRAAGMSLMMWALALTSAAGSLLILDRVPHEELGNAGWGLFLAANVGAVALWAAVGAAFQNAIWSSFNVPTGGEAAWKAPALAFGAAFLLVALNLVLQGVVASMQGVDRDVATMEQIHHNLGFAFALGIGGALVIAITILLGARGFRRAPGIALGAGMMIFGHATAFLWFPELGIAATLLAVAALPAFFLGLGYYFWRRG